jgi:co-chaperonin GroES (HSP10)
MITQLLSQRSMLIALQTGIDELINQTYRQSLSVKVGDEVVMNGNRGIVTEITYFHPMKICLYRKDGTLSRTHRL